MDTSGFFYQNTVKFLESFFKATPMKENDFSGNPVCGVFYAGKGQDAKKYNETISFFLEYLASLYLEALRKGLGKKWDDATKAQLKEIRQNILSISERFINFLKGEEDTSERAILTAEMEENKENFSMHFLSTELNNIRIYYTRRKKNGEFSFYYVNEDFQIEVDEILSKYRSGEINDKEKRDAFYLISLRATITLLKGLCEISTDKEVKEFFYFLIRVVELAIQGDSLAKALLNRFLKLKVDAYFALPEEEDNGEGVYVSHKPLITWLGYFESPLSEKDVLIRIGEQLFKDWRKRYSEDEETAIMDVKEELSLSEDIFGSSPLKWIEKMYGKESKEFLKKVRKTISQMLKGKVKAVKSVPYGKINSPFNSAKRNFYVHGKEKVLFFLSDGNFEELKDGGTLLYETIKKGNKYMNTGKLVKERRFAFMNYVFPYWDYLKENYDRTSGKWSEKFLAFLLQLGAFTKAIKKYEKETEREFILFFLLDVEEEEILPFWNAVRAFYNYALSFPAQTITRASLRKLRNSRERLGIVKNAFLSAILPIKELELVFEKPLESSIKKIYILVEHQTTKIAGIFPHYVYHLYSVSIHSQNKLRIRRENEVFYVFADRESGDFAEIHDFIRKVEQSEPDTVILCMSSDRNSPLFSIKGSLITYPILYRERKIQIDMAKRDKKKKKSEVAGEAYFIFEKDFKPFLRYLGYEENKPEGYSLIGVRAPFTIPPHLEKEPYVNTVLSLFFIGNLQGENPKTQELFIISLLSWLSFLSESYLYGFVKAKFMPRRLPNLRIARKVRIDKNNFRREILDINTGMALVELAFLVKRSLRGEVN